MTVEERFLSKTRPGPNGCLDWTGAKTPAGYGRFSLNGTAHYAHHIALMLDGRDAPVGERWRIHTDHLCGRPCCVNAAHLEVVPSKVNAQRGAVATLTPAQVIEIRRRYAAEGGSYRAFGLRHASEYGISPRTFARILNRTAWSNIKEAA